jgi:hypothetical protein
VIDCTSADIYGGEIVVAGRAANVFYGLARFACGMQKLARGAREVAATVRSFDHVRFVPRLTD